MAGLVEFDPMRLENANQQAQLSSLLSQRVGHVAANKSGSACEEGFHFIFNRGTAKDPYASRTRACELESLKEAAG